MMSETALRDLNLLPKSERTKETSSKDILAKTYVEPTDENVEEKQRKSIVSLVEPPVNGNEVANSGAEVVVVEMEYIESEKLKDLEDVDKSLKVLIPGLESKDWVLLCETLNNVRRLSIYHKEALQDILDNVITLVVKALKNPRSAVCKTAIMTSADIFKAFGDSIVDFLDPLLVVLLLKSSQDKRFVCEASEKALITLTIWVSPVLLLPKLQPYLKNRNPRIRAKASLCVSRSVPRLGAEGRASNTMAANKFATMVHNNTNKITLVLIYTFLEWTLIILLLFNSIFSYFIIKFARFFGLKSPCLWCVRLDRFFEPEFKNSHRDLLCELHSKEVSQLGFCLKHKKLAECNDMCEDCSFGFGEKSKNLVVSKAKKIDSEQSDGEDEMCLKCSCCGVEFERKSFDDSKYFVINPSWDFLGLSKNGNPIIDLIGSGLEDDNLGEKQEGQKQSKETGETEHEPITPDLIQFEKKEDANSEKAQQDLEFFLDYSGSQLVPIESIDPETEEFIKKSMVDEDQEFGDFQKAQVMSESVMETVIEEVVKEAQETVSALQNAGELGSVVEKTEENLSKFAGLESMEFEETENSLVFHANLSGVKDEKPEISEPARISLDSEEVQETEETDSDNEEAEVSIGTEIPVLETSDEMKAQDNFTLYSLSTEEPSTSSHDLDFSLEYEARKDEKTGFEEAREDEETGELTNMNQIDDTMLMIERKDSMVEESFDGSEMDGGDPINTTEKLKSALRAERKSLQALYIELEEERNASAVAASETMAMINRLQEEKAAMQMEALHYQRMMEEQSEYDQEALQLLNDLMVKKEKELEMYRKKVMDYETKERMRFLSSSVKSGTCSASCSHSEDGDGVWVDEPKEEGISNGNRERQHHNTPVDSVLDLDSSFVDFEDERMSILEQLKVLEEKLFTLSDEEDRHFSDLRHIEDYFEENGKHLNGSYNFDSQEVNGITNGFPKEAHETYYQDRRSIGSTGKRLLPLFEALDAESDDGVITSNGHETGHHSNKMENTAITLFELQKKRIDIEEEVDNLYVRLQALEADREFLKHCIGSLKKGDKGIDLLQEILQHLRDLRSVDLRAKNFTDGTLI